MSISADDFHKHWFGNCGRCPATDVPIFCSIGSVGVCTQCFLKAIKKNEEAVARDNALQDTTIQE